MPMPQLTDRIKEAPATVLRAIFAGVGQLLLAVDKLRNEVLDHDKTPGGATGQPTAARPAPPQEAGNVRPLREEPAAAPSAGTAPAQPAAEAGPAAGRQPAQPAAEVKPAAEPEAGPAAETKPARKPAPRKPAAAKPAGTAKPAAKAGTTGGATPPLPNYDELTVASLRARMRGLDAAGIRALLEYERAHAGRDTVVAMYERRLAKLASEAG